MRFKDHAKSNILKLLLALFSTILFISLPQNKVHASIKNTINYQAKITQKVNGLNASAENSPCIVTNSADTCDLRVRVWNVSTGGTATAGNNLLYEELFTDQEIGDVNGTVNLAINSICGATTSGTHAWGTSAASTSVCNLFDDNADGDTTTGINFNRNDLYFELSFDPSGTWSTLASPPGGIETFTRTLLKTAPSAFVAQTLNGFTAGQFVQLSPTAIQSTSSSTGAIRINQQGSGNLLQIQIAGVDRLVVDSNGQVQLSSNLSTGGVQLGDSGIIYSSTSNVLTVTSSLEIALNSTINGLSNFKGNVRSLLTIGNGSTTTTSTGTSTRNLTVTSTTNFEAGNIVLVNGTTYSRIDSIDSTTNMTVTPAQTWSAGQTVVEYTVPFVGGDGLAANLNQQFDSAFVTNYLKTGGDSTGTTYGDKVINAPRGLKVESANQTINNTQLNINTSGLYINKSDNLTNTTGSWGVGTTGGTARLGYSAVTVGTKIYYWGGTANNTTGLNTMDILDTTTNTWSTGAAGGTGRWYASGSTNGTNIYFWGGTTNGTAAINTIDIYNISGNSWSTGTAGGTAAWGAPGMIVSGKFYIWAGWTGAAYVNTMRIYDIAGNSWSTGTAGGTARGYNAPALYSNKLYFWGGCVTNAGCTAVINTLDIYDITGNSWSTGTAGGTARGISAIAGTSSTLYAIAGYNGTAYTNIVDVYDFARNSWSKGPSGGTAKGAFSAVVVNNLVYLWGGWTGSFLNTLDIFSAPTSGTWTTGKAGGTARGHGLSAVYQGKFYFWSGALSGQILTNILEIYDPSTDTWSAGASGGTARAAAVGQVYNGKWYIFDGCDNNACSTFTNVVDIYDFASNSWSTGASGGTARAAAMSALRQGSVYIWAGCNGVSCGTGLTSVDIYNIASNSWSTGTSGGLARVTGVGVIYNDRLYGWGGLVSGVAVNTLDIYDIKSNTWTTGTAGGSVKYWSSGFVFENKLYTWGGYTSAALNSMDIYDFGSNTWSIGLAGGTARDRYYGQIYGGKMYVWGGIIDNGAVNIINTVDIYDFGSNNSILRIKVGDQERLNLSTDNILSISGRPLGLNYPLKESGQYTTAAWSTGTSGGTARRLMQSQEYKNKIYTWGGYTSVAINTMDIYDTVTDSWTTGATGGTARYLYTSTIYNGKIYYFGGCTAAASLCSAGTALNTVDVYNIETDSWSTATAGGTARGEAGGVQFDNKFYIWSGLNGTPAFINTLDIYNFTTDSWTTGTAGGTARAQFTAFIYNGRMFAWGGVNSSNTAINTVDIYDILGNVWTTGTAGGTARFGYGAVMYNSLAYFWGGCTVSGCGTRLNTTDIYNPATNTWAVGIAGGTATGSVGAALANNKMYNLFGFTTVAVNTNYNFDFGVSRAEEVLYITNAEGIGPDEGKLFRFDATGRAYTSKQGGWFSVGADYAEYMHVNDLTLEKGDIVKLDKTDSKSLVKTDQKNDPNVIGVISTDPGFVGNITSIDDINNNRSDMKLLSMVGQVPVKVNTENGEIKSGDRITASSMRGVGMKASEGDTNIGIAQESFSSEGIGIISVLITRNNEGISNKLQINLGEKGEAGFRLTTAGKMQYKDEYGEWNDISKQIELDTSISWKKIGDHIYNTNNGITSIGVNEGDLSGSKLQISKDVEARDGLKFLKLASEGTILMGGLNSEVGFRVNSTTGALEYRDALTKNWKNMSGILVSRMYINPDGTAEDIKNSLQISGWGYIRGDSSSNLLSKQITLSTPVKNLLVLSNIIGYSDTQPKNPTECSNYAEDNITTEVNIESSSRFNIIINNGLDVIPGKYVCFNWLALGKN